MRIFITRVLKANPTSFIGVFGVWCLLVGISLTVPGDAFTYTPAWRSLQAIRAADYEWGWFMIANGLILMGSIRLNPVPARAAIALSSSIIWFLIGGSMVYNGYQFGLFSPVGAFSIWCAFQSMMAVEQWVNHAEGVA